MQIILSKKKTYLSQLSSTPSFHLILSGEVLNIVKQPSKQQALGLLVHQKGDIS
jgi:hypothetical protein